MLTVIQGDCRDKLRELADESVHCVISSPPYWGLRDYGVDGQLGLEPTPEAYVAEMVAIFRKVRRVLRADGTCWMNLGDSYYNYRPGGISQSQQTIAKHDGAVIEQSAKRNGKFNDIKEKDLLGIPWAVAFALRADGWYLRSEIIWHKPNPMPESVTDRPTKSHEQVFLLAKSASYFYDAEAIKEPSSPNTNPRMSRAEIERITDARANGANTSVGSGRDSAKVISDGLNKSNHSFENAVCLPVAARNRRTVWTIATQPYTDAHFATFPAKLVEPCILAGTSARGCCASCGAPWERVVEQSGSYQAHWAPGTQHKQSAMDDGRTSSGGVMETGFVKTYATTGWQPTCEHINADIVPCTVLDPFAGSGTVGQVALSAGRRAVLIELNPDYCRMIEKRNAVTYGLPGLA